METVVNGSTLNMGYKNGVNVKNSNVEVYVTLPALESVVTNGSGHIDVKVFLTAPVCMQAHQAPATLI